MSLSGGYNLLMLAAEEGDTQKVFELAKKDKINDKNQVGYSALALAVKNGHADVCRALITLGADVNSCNNAGQSVLFIACWQGREECVDLLIEKGANINQPDQRGWTPLIIAVYHSHLRIVEVLLQSGADLDLQDCFGKKAIDRAKSIDIFNLLEAVSMEQRMLDSPQVPQNPLKMESKQNKSYEKSPENKMAQVQKAPSYQVPAAQDTVIERRKKMREELERQVQARIKVIGSQLGELACDKIEQELQENLDNAEKAIISEFQAQLMQISQTLYKQLSLFALQRLDSAALAMGLQIPHNNFQPESEFQLRKMKKTSTQVEGTKIHDLENLVTIAQPNPKQEPQDIQQFMLRFMDKGLEILASRLGSATADKIDRDIIINIQKLGESLRLELRTAINRLNQVLKIDLQKLINERFESILQSNSLELGSSPMEKYLNELRRKIRGDLDSGIQRPTNNNQMTPKQQNMSYEKDKNKTFSGLTGEQITRAKLRKQNNLNTSERNDKRSQSVDRPRFPPPKNTRLPQKF